jgi:hypothetical protein
MRSNHSNSFQTLDDALAWMLRNGMIIRSTSKHPETLATVRGFVLSDEFGQSIGFYLLELFTKAIKKRRNGLSGVTVRDAFLMATIAAVMKQAEVTLSEGEMQLCASILLSLLPIDRLAQAGIADITLRNLARDRLLIRKVQRVCGQT